MALIFVILGSFACGNTSDGEPTPPVSTTPPTSSPSPSETPPPTTLPPTTQPPSWVRNELDLSTGQKWNYQFYESGTPFGMNELMMTGMEAQEENDVYVIESHLDLDSSSSCQPTVAEGTLKIDRTGYPLSYHETASIGSG